MRRGWRAEKAGPLPASSAYLVGTQWTVGPVRNQLYLHCKWAQSVLPVERCAQIGGRRSRRSIRVG